MDNWDDLKYVLAVSRNGGVSGAARALGVNHTTVSRRITNAESHLGVRLFDRLSSGFKLTEDGGEVVQHVLDIEKSIADLELKVASRDQLLSGELVVTAPEILIQQHLAGVFSDFVNLYGEIQLTVMSSNETLNLHQREADVAIRISDNPDGALFGKRCIKQTRAFYAAEDYYVKKTNSNLLAPSEIDFEFVNFKWWGKVIPDDFLSVYPRSRLVASFNDMVALYGAVKAGMGVSLLPCFIGETDPSLLRITDCHPKAYRDIWVLTHPDLKNVERVRCFMSFVADALRRDEALYSLSHS